MQREHSDRFLCSIGALKFYLKMTRPYRQIELDYFYQLEANKIFLNPLSRDGFLIIINLPTGNSLIKIFPSLRFKPMKLGLYIPFGSFSISFAQGDSNSNMESIFCICCLRDMSQQLQACLIWAQLWWPKKWWGPS